MEAIVKGIFAAVLGAVLLGFLGIALYPHTALQGLAFVSAAVLGVIALWFGFRWAFSAR